MTTIVRTGVEWIDTFSGPCKQNNVFYRQNCAEGFQNAMASYGHTSVFDWGDDNAWETDFRSPNFGGDSLNWSDNVHFCYFTDHGANTGSVFEIFFTAQQDYCFGSSNQWTLGANMLKWAVFDTCDLVLGTDAASVTQWFGPMQNVHIVFGFVNLAYDDGGRGANFGNDAGSGNPLSNVWLTDAVGSDTRQTAIAIAAGSSQADAINRRENETIDWRDINVTATTWLAWKWYS
jgi:Family of unknown function (DUF6345)